MDRELRTLEREAGRAGDPVLRARLEAASARAGYPCPGPEVLRILADLDPPGATQAGSDPSPPAERLLGSLSEVVLHMGTRAGVAAVVSALRSAGLLDGLPARWLRFVSELEAWCRAGGLEEAARLEGVLPPPAPGQIEVGLLYALRQLAWAALAGESYRVLLAISHVEELLPLGPARGAVRARLTDLLPETAGARRGALAEAADRLRRRVELGELAANAVLLAAFAGDPAAREALRSVRSFGDPPLGEWLLGLSAFDEGSPFLRAVVGLARGALPTLLWKWPRERAPLRAVQQLELRLRPELEYHQRIPVERLGELCFRGSPRVRAAAGVVFHAALLWVLPEPERAQHARPWRRSSSRRPPGHSALRVPLGRRRGLVMHSFFGAAPRFDLPWRKGLSYEQAVQLVTDRLAAAANACFRRDPRPRIAAEIALLALQGKGPYPTGGAPLPTTVGALPTTAG